MRRGSQSGPAGWSANDRVSSQFDSLARKKKVYVFAIIINQRHCIRGTYLGFLFLCGL